MITVLAIIGVIFFIVLIHEGGHFVVAKLSGIDATEFAFGMGPVLASFKAGGTRYCICLLPIGGYVKIAGMEPDDEDTPRGYNRQPIYKRAAVVVAGPVMNFVGAFLLVFLLGFTGFPKTGVRVNSILPGSPAAVAGVKRGDFIQSIGGHDVKSPYQLNRVVRASSGVKLDMVVERGGQPVSLTITPGPLKEETGKVFNEGRPSVGVSIAEMVQATGEVTQVVPASNAYKAGIRAGDVINAIDGIPISDGVGVYDYILDHPKARSYIIGIERRGAPMTLAMPGTADPLSIGLDFRPLLMHLPFAQAMHESWTFALNLFANFVYSLKMLFTHGGAGGVLGPVGITQVLAQSARAGWFQLITIAVLLSLSVGVMNLIPFPPLDGSRLLFLFIEGVIRVKVSARREALVHAIGMVMLLALFALVTLRDIKNILGL